MAVDDEVSAQLGYLEEKIKKVTGAVSAMSSSLATGSVWQRINGQILVPESVNEGVIAPLAITETKIDSEAVTTPKLAANSVTANKLEAQLVLSTEIVAGSYSAPDYHGVRLDSSGLRLYDGSGNQRGLMSVNGSGWLGSSTALSWTDAGVVTATGITIATASSGARLYLNTSGITIKNASDYTVLDLTPANGLRLYDATGANQRASLYPDGSGWFGSTTGLVWTTGGAITATGITVRSASTTAKAQLDSTGLGIYNATAVKTGYLNTNGSGWLGDTVGDGTAAALSWNTAGTAVINASAITTGSLNAGRITSGTLDCSTITVSNLSANSINAGTITAARISGGNLAGGIGLGSSDVTIGGSGKLKFGASSLDYLGDNKLHFDVTTSEVSKIDWKNTTAPGSPSYTDDYYSEITAKAGASFSELRLQSLATRESTQKSGFVTGTSVVGANDATAAIYAQTSPGATDYNAGINLYATDSGAGTNYVLISVYNAGSSAYAVKWDGTSRRSLFYGALYPGNNSDTEQTSRGISDNGTAMVFGGPYLRIVGSSGASNPILYFDSAYSSGSTAAWSTNGPGTGNITSVSTTYILVNIGGTLYRMPIWANS